MPGPTAVDLRDFDAELHEIILGTTPLDNPPPELGDILNRTAVQTCLGTLRQYCSLKVLQFLKLHFGEEITINMFRKLSTSDKQDIAGQEVHHLIASMLVSPLTRLTVLA